MRVGGGKLETRKKLRRKSAEKMGCTFELFRSRNVAADGWKAKKRKS
jgi:hypothetical protein